MALIWVGKPQPSIKLNWCFDFRRNSVRRRRWAWSHSGRQSDRPVAERHPRDDRQGPSAAYRCRQPTPRLLLRLESQVRYTRRPFLTMICVDCILNPTFSVSHIHLKIIYMKDIHIFVFFTLSPPCPRMLTFGLGPTPFSIAPVQFAYSTSECII